MRTTGGLKSGSVLIFDYDADYFFTGDLYRSFYRDEERIDKIFMYSASLAIFLSCLGLFGLTAFGVQRRTKEIGIRKVLGASHHECNRNAHKVICQMGGFSQCNCLATGILLYLQMAGKFRL
jgi:hypothetical protein